MEDEKKFLRYCINDGSEFWSDREDEIYCPFCRSLNVPEGEAQPPEPRQENMTIRSIDAPAVPDWQPGQVILGGFEVVRLIAEGGLSRVFQVRHLFSGKELTMKAPQTRLLQHGETVRQYAREAETLFDCRVPEAPYVLQIHQARVWKGVPLLFTELADGGDLSQLIRSGELYQGGHRQVLGRILDLAIQSAQALVGLHARAIIHADVKPSNMLLTKEGQLRLSGFELTRRLSSGKQSIEISGYTPAYCSPEQAKGELITKQTDMWSWGLSVLEMFIGEMTWYSGIAAKELLEDYLENGPDNQSMPIMPDGLPAVLRQCFQADPGNRPERMAPLIETLQRIYRGVTGQDHQLDRSDAWVRMYSYLVTLDDRLTRGIFLFEFGQYDRAVQEFEMAVSGQESGWARLNLGLARLCLRPFNSEAALECFSRLPSYQDPGFSVGQVSEHFMSIMDIRLDRRRNLVWIAGDIGIALAGGPSYAPYTFQGVNCSPAELPEFDSQRWFRYHDSERYPWQLAVDDAERLETGLHDTLIFTPSAGFHCRSCTAELSGEADRDGRAEELRDTVAYLCRACAEQQSRLRGKAFGDYWLLKELGRNWMGAIYEAWHEPTRRVYVLTYVPEDYPAPVKKLAESKISIWKGLDHPNLVRLVGIDDTPDGPICLIGSDPGVSLETMLDRHHGTLPYELAVELLLQILDGLAYLHEKGFVHRNVTTINIDTRQIGSRTLARLSGFELATDYVNVDGTIDDTGETAGTLMYMPVEQITAFRHCKPTVDIYAAGVTLYYLLTGCYSLPFPCRAEIAKGVRYQADPIKIILEAEPIPIRQRKPDLPAALAQVIDRAVRKKKEERYQTALEFKQALEAALVEVRDTAQGGSLTIAQEQLASVPRPAYCALCGADVTAQANSDGRAAELTEHCIYWCALCAYTQSRVAEVEEHGYLEIKFLGGGFGETWLAWHPQTGRVVTLRRMRFWRRAEQNINRYIEDIQQLALIPHPALTFILDTCLVTNEAIAVSAYLPGDDLWTWAVEKASTLSIKPEVEKALHLLAGLIHLKQSGWDYNNLHPWNILIPSANPQRPRLCTADFQPAYLIDCLDMDPERDPTWQECARWLYAPPEAIVNAKHPSPTKDIYGLGMALYIMLTRKLPFDFPLKPQRDIDIDPILNALKVEPIPIRQRQGWVPNELAEVIDRALKKQAAERYQSLEELREALEQAKTFCG